MKPAAGEIIVEPGESLGERLYSALKNSEIKGSYILLHVIMPFDTDYDAYILRVPDAERFSHEIIGEGDNENVGVKTEVLHTDDRNAYMLFTGKGDFYDYDAEMHIRGFRVVEIGRPFHYKARIISGDDVRKFLSRYGPTKLDI